MKLIVITWPRFLPSEALLLSLLIDNGADRIHIRKPDASADEVRQLINAIPADYHDRLVLHDHYQLINEFTLAGIHLNQRNLAQLGSNIPYSCSCHSIEEIGLRRDLVKEYLFLSPIFDSISKTGYQAAFTPENLRQASSDQIIREDTIALGGIDIPCIPFVRQCGFGGIALLGAIWNPFLVTGNPQILVETIASFQTQLKR